MRTAGGLLIAACVCAYAGPGAIPVHFEQNRGQADGSAAYIGRAAGLTALIQATGITVRTGEHRVSMTVAGANQRARLRPEGPLGGVSNYYLGGRRILGVPHYARVRAQGVRPGIDVVYYGAGGELEYDIVVTPGAPVSEFRLRFSGAAKPEVSGAGELIVRTGAGELRHRRPVAWQESAFGRRNIECRYEVARSGEVGFVLGEYDRRAAVTIDPVLSYSTYVRGSDPYGTSILAVSVDAAGNAFLAGKTSAFSFPATSGTYHGSDDVFVMKLNPSGTAVVFSTLIGGAFRDTATAMALDSFGAVFVTGETDSPDYPVSDGSPAKGRDAFVTKVEANGLVGYSTRRGGAGIDAGQAIAVDSRGWVYVTGTTQSGDFPVTAGAYRSAYAGNQDGFLLMIGTGAATVQSTYFGGSQSDWPKAIVVDPVTFAATIGGFTSSTDFPVTPNGPQPVSPGNGDGFLITFNPAATALAYGTFLGGSLTDSVNDVARDPVGVFLVTGTTLSSNFPVTPGAYSTPPPSPPNASGFVTKISATTGIVFSGYIGDGQDTVGSAVISDAAGNVVVAGTTNGAAFPVTPGSFKPSNGQSQDAFLVKLSATGNTLLYSTLLGSDQDSDYAYALALDTSGAAYIAGDTLGVAFPVTPGSLQGPPLQPTTSGFLSKIDLNSPVSCTPVLNPASVSVPGHGGTVSFTMTLASGCPWEVTRDSALTISGPTRGMGGPSPIPVTATINVNESLTASRTLLLRIGTAAFTITQAPSQCSDPSITPTSLAFDFDGGYRTLSIKLASACNWNIHTKTPWLGSSDQGYGSRDITISAHANPFSARNGSVTVAGRTIAVTQAGSNCTASLDTAAAAVPAAGGRTTVRISTGAVCLWTGYPLTSWIRLVATNQLPQGPSTIPIEVAANHTNAPRTGELLIADQRFVITQAAGPVGAASYTSSLYAGGGRLGNHLVSPKGIAWDGNSETLCIADPPVVRSAAPDGTITILAGGGTASDTNVPPTAIDLGAPAHLRLDSSGAVLIHGGSRVHKVAGGAITHVAGTGVIGDSGDGGPATAAQIGNSGGVAADASGNVYIGDMVANRIRKISGGMISAFAGGGSTFSDNMGALQTSLRPLDLLTDPAGVLYVSDGLNSRIRRITIAPSPTITTVAGGGSSSADGIPATTASIAPGSMALTPAGALMFVDGTRIRRIDSNGLITTVFQTGNAIGGIAADNEDNIYFVDATANVVRKLTLTPAFCSFSLQLSLPFPAAGGAATVGVTTTAGCAWSVASDVSWITSSASGTGSGTATITLAANGGSSRSAVIYVAGQAVTIVQSSGGATMPYRPRDIRGNGRSDVVLYDANAGSAFTGLSNGDGTFNYVASSYYPGYDTVRMGDWNGDGKADLIVYNSITSFAYIGHGDGSGRFNFQSLFWSPGYKKVLTTDFNRDGKTDVILCTPDGTTYTGLSNGDGTFRYTYRLVSPGYTHVVTGDFNGDGKPDVFFYRQTDSLAFVGIGDGNANFTFREVPGVNLGNDHVQAGDVNGDGNDDLLLYNSANGAGRVAISTGNAFTIVTNFWNPGYTSVLLFDYTADGKADVFLYNRNTTLGLIGNGLGNGLFGFAPLYWGAGIDYIDVLDLNADGKQDVILYSSPNGFAYSGLNTGNLTSPFTYQYLTWGVGRIVAK